VIFLWGSPFPKQRRGFKGGRLPYSRREQRKCAEDAKITRPTYQPRGGACILALDRVGATWYGFETAIQLRLLFDASGALVEREFLEVHTFL
jgi:hypothetical protein